MAVRLADAIVFFKSDDKELKSGFDKAETQTKSWANRMGSAVQNATRGIMVGAAVAATTAIVGIGKAAFDVSSDTRAAANDMAASLGIPTEEAEKFAQVAKKVFANNFADDVREAGDAVKLLVQQFENLNDVELQGLAESAFAIRDAFDADYAGVIGAAKTLTEEFGISGQEAMDLIATGFQAGLDRSGDFLDTINEYSLQFAGAEATAGQFFDALDGGLKSGMLGTDKAADLFKEFTLRIQDGSDKTKDALKELFGGFQQSEFGEKIANAEKKLEKYRNQLELAKVRQGEFNEKTKESARLASEQKISELTKKIREQEGALGDATKRQSEWNSEIEGFLAYQGGGTQLLADLNSGVLTQVEVFGMLQQAIGNVTDEEKRNELAVALLGTQYDDLGLKGFQAMDMLVGAFNDVEGATESLNAQYQNFGDLASGAWRKFIVALTPVTDKLLELAIERMPQVDKAISQLVPILENLAINVLVPLVEKIFEWIDAFANLSPEMQQIVTVGGLLLGALIPIIAILGPMVGVVTSVIGVFTKLGPIVLGAGKLILGLTGPLGLLVAGLGLLLTAWVNDWGGIQEKTYAVLGAIGDFFSSWWVATKTLFGTNLAAIKTSLSSGWDSVKSGTSTAWGGISSFFSSWWSAATTLFNTNLTALKTSISTGWTSIKSNTSSAWDTIKSNTSSTWGSIKSTVSTTGSAIKESFSSALTNLISSARTKSASVVTTIKSAFNINWSSVGLGIVNGIAGGISAGAGAIASAARSAASSALASAKSALGIQSPSKLAEREVGMPWSQGVAKGVLGGIPEIQSAIRRGIDVAMDVNIPSFGGVQQTKNHTPISVVQNFYGDADSNTVRQASQFGVRDALRMAGVAT